MMETAYSKLNVGNFLKLHNMILTQQQRIVSKGAMNSFKKMFPLAVINACASRLVETFWLVETFVLECLDFN